MADSGRPPLRPIYEEDEDERSSLLKPLTQKAVLISDEEVYYAARQHWASLFKPFYETFIVLLVIVWATAIFGSGDGRGDINLWVGALIVGAAIQTVTGARLPTSRLGTDPFYKPGAGLGNLSLGAAVAAFALGLWAANILVAITAAIFIVMLRFAIILAQWSFYEVRYITNRRVIESGGFLGARISSMPLSRVTDISYGRSITGELFGYSAMRVETAGQDQALGTVRFIANPDRFYEVLIDLSAPKAAPPTAKPIRRGRTLRRTNPET